MSDEQENLLMWPTVLYIIHVSRQILSFELRHTYDAAATEDTFGLFLVFWGSFFVFVTAHFLFGGHLISQ